MLATRLLALASVVLFSAVGALAQADEEGMLTDEFVYDSDISSNLPTLPSLSSADSVLSDWKDRFSTAESMSNFKLLREYRTEKQTLILELRDKLGWYTFYRDNNAQPYLARLLESRRGLETDLQQAQGDEVLVQASLPVAYDAILGAQTPGPVGVQQVRALINTLTGREREAGGYLAEVQRGERLLEQSIRVAEADLRQAEAAIDSALAPEIRSQSFRTWISGFFAILIGIMIIAFFSIIFVRSDGNVASLMLSDGGLQFVTIFVLIIAIILFGILSILEGKELAAILSGLAGYILGRGSQPKSGEGKPAGEVQPSTAAKPARETPPRRFARRLARLAEAPSPLAPAALIAAPLGPSPSEELGRPE